MYFTASVCPFWGIIGIYMLSQNYRKQFLPRQFLLATTLLLFIFEPSYKSWGFTMLPDALAQLPYQGRTVRYLRFFHGSAMLLLAASCPWCLLDTNILNLYIRPRSFTAIIGGIGLIFWIFLCILKTFGGDGAYNFSPMYFFNNYLFIRLGDVFSGLCRVHDIARVC